MDLIASADAAYLRHGAAMLESLLAAHRGAPPRVHFLMIGPDPAGDWTRLAQVVGSRAELRRIAVPDDLMQGLKPHRRLGTSALAKLWLPELLPSLDRALYLDVDMIACQPLAALWALDLQGRTLAAARNPLYPHQPRAWLAELGLPDESRYFNTGVMLMDLAALRRGGWVAKLADFVRNDRGPMPFADQDVFNALLWQHRLELPLRWNAQVPLFELPPRAIGVEPQEARAAVADPAIVHYNGPDKPWSAACPHPLRHLYWGHAARTPWRGAPPERPGLRSALYSRLPFAARYWFVKAEKALRRLR